MVVSSGMIRSNSLFRIQTQLKLDPKEPAGTIAPGVVLYAFLVGLAVALAATAFAVGRGLNLWRQAKRTGKSFTAELTAFEERAARTERFLAAADTSSRDLEASLARLHVSRARLDVLLGSLEAAQRRTRWLRVLLPLR